MDLYGELFGHGYQGEGTSLHERMRLAEGVYDALKPEQRGEITRRVDSYREHVEGGSRGKIRLHNDFETYCDESVTDLGASRYARHPSCENLMLGYAFQDDEIKQWVPAEGQRMPKDLRDATRDPDVVFFAWNKPFEWSIWKHVEGIEIPHERWRDAMVLAYSLALPGSLEKAGEVVQLPQDQKKHSRGKALIRKFCAPRKPTKTKPWTRAGFHTDPKDWEEFKDYNRADVGAERAIWKRLRAYNMPQHEWELWVLDQIINEAGIPVNMKVVDNAIDVAANVVRKRLQIMADITGLKNPNSTGQLLPWLQDEGYPFDDLKKGHVKRALERVEEISDGDPAVLDYKRVLELRQEVSKSSVKKYNALKARTDDDGYLRYVHQFAGAGRTWRWAGRGYQAQNLARPVWYLEKEHQQIAAVKHLEELDYECIEQLYPKPMDVLSTCVRPVVQAPPGFVFLDADLNAIENRVLGLIADCQKILDVFIDGRDPYVDFATYMYDSSYETLWREYKVLGRKDKRTLAKPAVLGCGYMLGKGVEIENAQTGEIEGTGLLGYAWNMGVKMTPEQSEHAVKVWRETYSEVVEFWYALETAAKKCVRTGEPTECGILRFDMKGPFLRMLLPSGRALHYCRPRLEERVMPWGKTKTQLTYEGLNDKNQWVRIATHPGKLTENADQAIARDLLGHGMVLAYKREIDIRLHVHDQIVAMAPEDQAERALQILIDCMETPPRWTGNRLPLKAEGHISHYFIKD